MIQELTEELQVIDQEPMNDEQDLEATQESDLEQEDSEDCLTDVEEQCLSARQNLSSQCSKQKKIKDQIDRTIITIQQENLDENTVNHTEEMIIGSEQGTTFPTKVDTTMCNALIDTGATRSCMSTKYYRKLHLIKFICY